MKKFKKWKNITSSLESKETMEILRELHCLYQLAIALLQTTPMFNDLEHKYL